MRVMIVACLLFFEANSFAQLGKLELPAEDKPNERRGWRFSLDLAGTESWTTNENIPSVTSGHYVSLGFKTTAKAELHEQPHEWKNRLTLLETFTRTPPIEEFLKAADRFTLVSEYLYLLHPKGGLFARALLEAPLFAGDDVRGKEFSYRITDVTGETTTVKAERLHLTEAFLPLKLRQSIGAFIRLHNDENLLWEIKAGAMAFELIAPDQKLVEKKSGNTIRVKTLANSFQFGPTVGMKLEGAFHEKRITYKAELEAYYMAFRESALIIPNTFVDRLNYEGEAEISLKITDWLWISFEEKLTMVPEISKDPQVMSQLFLNFKLVL